MSLPTSQDTTTAAPAQGDFDRETDLDAAPAPQPPNDVEPSKAPEDARDAAATAEEAVPAAEETSEEESAAPNDAAPSDAEAPAEPETEEPAAASPATRQTDEAKKAPSAEKDREALEQRATKFKTDFAAFRERISKPGHEFDPFGDGAESARLMMEMVELINHELGEVRHVTHQAQAAVEEDRFWAGYAAKHPEVGDRARTLFGEEMEKAVRKYGDTDAARAVATERWEDRLNLIKAQHRTRTTARAAAPVSAQSGASAKPGLKAPPVTPGGGKVTPQRQTTRPPAPKPTTLQERIAAGEFGNLSEIVD